MQWDFQRQVVVIPHRTYAPQIHRDQSTENNMNPVFRCLRQAHRSAPWLPAIVSSLVLVLPHLAQATTTTIRAATPTMAADQSGCATINYFDIGRPANVTGPGTLFNAFSEVPWSALKGCDTVRIYAKPNNGTYNEMMLISAGTDLTPTAPTQFMRVIGVPDPVTGALPIIDGTNATQLETALGQATPRSLRYFDNLQANRALYKLGLVMVSGQIGRSYNFGPAGYISIENLDIRNAVYNGSFADAQGGGSGTYHAFTSCIYVEIGAHLVLKNNTLRNCGNGLFINSKNSVLVELSQDVLVEGNRFYNNSNAPGTGTSNGYSEHQSYTEARDIIFQYNTFGDVKAGAFGDCLKDRSSGLIVRYNTFASNCAIQLNFEDSTGGQALIWGDTGYAQTFVYGNLFDVTPQPSSALVHYGGDSGVTAHYRQGTLYFYNNTLASQGDAANGAYPSIFLFNLALQNAVADVRNNVFYSYPNTAGMPGKVQAMSIGRGTVNMAANWVSPNAAQFWLGHLVAGAVVNGWNSNISGNNSPLLVNASLHDFRPTAASPLVNAGAALAGSIASSGNLPTGVVGAAVTTLRAQDANIDIGAYEYSPAVGVAINGACGAANGVATAASPVLLCAAGNASLVTPTATSFDWSCVGTAGGSTASCSAPLIVVATGSKVFTGNTATGTGVASATISGSIGAGCGFTQAQFIALTTSQQGTVPAGLYAPHGLFDFTLGGCAPGSTVSVAVTWPLSPPLPAASTQYWSYGASPGNPLQHWYKATASFVNSTTSIDIPDGLVTDNDLTVNGIIKGLNGPFIAKNCTMDIDGDGAVLATTDGLLLARAAVGITGNAIVAGALGAAATRTSWPQIRDFLVSQCSMSLAP